jgi:hypothetical protein
VESLPALLLSAVIDLKVDFGFSSAFGSSDLSPSFLLASFLVTTGSFLVTAVFFSSFLSVSGLASSFGASTFGSSLIAANFYPSLRKATIALVYLFNSCINYAFCVELS